MNQEIKYIIVLVFVIILIYNSFVFIKLRDLKNLEKKLNLLLEQELNSIIGLYSLAKDFFTKPKDVFNQVFRISENISIKNNDLEIEEIYLIRKTLKKETEFIFKISEKNKYLKENHMFDYMKNSILEKDIQIGKILLQEKNERSKYKKLKRFSNLTLFGVFF